MAKRHGRTTVRLVSIIGSITIVTAALLPSAKAADEIFALVVTNNRSLVKHRPNLHYADDDGARAE